MLCNGAVRSQGGEWVVGDADAIETIPSVPGDTPSPCPSPCPGPGPCPSPCPGPGPCPSPCPLAIEALRLRPPILRLWWLAMDEPLTILGKVDKRLWHCSTLRMI